MEIKSFDEQIKADLHKMDCILRKGLKFFDLSDSQIELALMNYHDRERESHGYPLDEGYEVVFRLCLVGNLLVSCKHCGTRVNSSLNICRDLSVVVQIIECPCCDNSHIHVVGSLIKP